MSILIYALPILIAIGLGIVQFDAGKRQLAQLIAGALGPGTEVELGDFSGSPANLRLDRLTIGDEDGVWLALEDFRFAWAPSALLRGRLRIETLSAGRLAIERLPPGAAKPAPPPEQPRSFEIPGLPGALRGIIVEKVAVERLALGAPLLGEAAVFKVSGGLEAGDPHEQFDLKLVARRVDEPTARLVAHAALTPQPDGTRILALDMEGKETGGLLSAVAGLPPGANLTFNLEGTAPVTDWRGRLVAEAGGVGHVDAAFGLRGAADLSSFLATADGRLDIAPGLVPELEAALGRSPAHFALRLRRPEGQPETLVLEQVTVSAGPSEAEAAGRIDLAADTVDATFALSLAELAPLSDVVGTPLMGGLDASGKVSGPLSRPNVTASFRADGLQVAGASAARFSGDVRLGAPERGTGWRVDGDGGIRGLAIEGADLPEEDFTWSVAALVPGRGPVTVRTFGLSGSSFALTGSGRVAPADGTFTADTLLEVSDLERLAGAPLPDLPPAPRLRLQASGSFAGPLAVTLDGRLDRLEPLPPALAALVGEAITVTADARLEEGDQLRISRLAISGAAAELVASAGIDLAQGALQAEIDATVPQLAVLSPALGEPLAGALAIDTALGGSFAAPVLDVDAVGRDVRFREYSLERVVAEGSARDLLTRPRGQARLSVPLDGQAHVLATAFALRDGGRLHLSDLALSGPAAEAVGGLTIDMRQWLIDGEIRGRSSDLSALGRLAGRQIDGKAVFTLDLAPREGGQSVALALTGRGLTSPFAQADEVQVRAELRDALRDPRGRATLSANDIRRSGVTVASLAVQAEGGLDVLAFEGDATGMAGDPFQLSTAGSLAIQRQAIEVELARLAGTVAGEPLSLAAPATLRVADGVVAVDSLALEIAGGRLAASGRYGPQAIDLDMDLSGLPLALAGRFGGPPLEGEGAARLSLSGTPQRPEAELDVTLAGVKPADPLYREAPAADLMLDASLRGGRLDARLSVARLFEAPVTAAASLPVTLSLQPFDMFLPPAQPIEGSINGEGELGHLVNLLLLDDQLLDGRVEVDVGFTGTLGRPSLQGGVRIEGGRYQNLTTGTVLADIEAHLAARGTQLVVDRFSATDAGNGRVTGRGSIDFAMDQGMPVSLALDVSNAVLVRREDLVAQLGGEMAIDGRLGEALSVRGNLVVGPAEARLPERLPPSVVELNVTYIDENGEIVAPPDGAAEEERLLATETITMDVDVGATRIFVRGRGLESEWEGEVRVTGTAAQPSIVGQLSLRRGFLNFLGRRLDLDSGRITFSGATPPVPVVDVVAVAQLEDGVRARIALRGDLTSPELVVTSEPELPQDEVLSQLLFGRVLSEITPLQAVKLAAAVNTLRGGGGLDLLGQARELLGVDVLQISQEQDPGATARTRNGREAGAFGGARVGVGKYVADNVYVEARRGLASNSGEVSVEIELTPNITASTAVGANAQTGVGLRWEWNY